MQPPYRCIFCMSSNGPFLRAEHPISESLGGSFTLAPGFVCDSCNQYFGTKVEQIALNAAPFGIERVANAEKTKKGKSPLVRFHNGDWIASSGYLDTVILCVDKSHPSFLERGIFVPPVTLEDDLCVNRLLLKMGLELLSKDTAIDPYSSCFNAARRYARFADPGSHWEYGEAVLPRSQRMTIFHNDTQEVTLYEYNLVQSLSGSVVFTFMYSSFFFACNLVEPAIGSYTRSFNLINSINMTIRTTKVK